MERVQEITTYMEQMKLKKVWFGGYDKEDVQLKFDMLMAMFEKYAKEQEKREQNLVNDYKNKLDALEETVMELNKNIALLTEENELSIKEQQKMKEAYKAYCSEIIKQYSESLRSLSGEFSKILENVSNMQKEIREETIIEGLDKALEISEGVSDEV